MCNKMADKTEHKHKACILGQTVLILYMLMRSEMMEIDLKDLVFVLGSLVKILPQCAGVIFFF